MAGGLEALLGKTIQRVMRALEGVNYAFIGGIAVYAHGYQRSTDDADVGICAPVRNLGALLERAGFKHKAGIRFRDPATGVTVDLFRVPAKFLPYLKDPEVRKLGRIEIPVIPLDMLLAMKMRAGRAQDEADVVELIKLRAPYDARRLDRWLKELEATGDVGVRKRFSELKDRARREVARQKRVEEAQWNDEGTEE